MNLFHVLGHRPLFKKVKKKNSLGKNLKNKAKTKARTKTETIQNCFLMLLASFPITQDHVSVKGRKLEWAGPYYIN